MNIPIVIPSGHDSDSLLTRWKEPKYPSDALSSGTTGELVLEFDVDRYGRIVSPEIVLSEPTGVFDKPVMESLKHWTVYPYLASHCIRDFPRSQIKVSFQLLGGKPVVKASRPLPLTNPAAKRTAKLVDGALADSGATEGVPKKPKLRWVSTPMPTYPGLWPGREPIAGNVVANLTVEPDGSIGEIETIFSSPYQEFANAAELAFKNWKAETIAGEKPNTRVKLCQPVSFRLASK